MSDSLKFQLLDYVRCTNSNLLAFDQVGRIVGRVVNSVAPYKVEFGGGKVQRLTEHELTLADPDVRTVLDQMDAESRVVTVGADTNNSFTMRITDPEHPAFKDITEQEIDGDYVRGLAADPVNHPQHYGGDTTYETIKVIEAWGLGFSIGNCVKYLSRAGKKGPVLEDLRKARFYLDREIAAAEATQ